MWDKVRSILLVIILVISGFMLVWNFGLDNTSVEGATLYVGPTSTYKKIQTAVNLANPGDTIYVDVGTYYESVTITKSSITLIGNSTTNCRIIHHYVGTAVNNYAAGINITNRNVNVTGFNISVTGNYTFGICLRSNANNANIINNNITTKGWNGYGLYLESAGTKNNNVINNKINTSGSSGYGIRLSFSSNNNLTGNRINTLGFGAGIYLRTNSNNNNISNNIINASGLNSNGIVIDISTGNTLTNNIINTTRDTGVGIYFDEASYNDLTSNIINTIGDNARGISLWKSSNCILTNNKINTTGQLNSHGIGFGQYSNFNNCTKNIINTTGDTSNGIYLYRSSYNNLTANSINTSGQDGYGIQFFDNSNKNNLTGNTINTSGVDGYGICAKVLVITQKSNSNNIMGNTINTYGLDGYGIYFEQSSNYNNITDNIINTYGQDGYGIYLDQSSNYNNITSNTINTSGLASYGIYLDQSSNNNLMGNTINTYNQGNYGIFLWDLCANNNLMSNKIKTNGLNAYGILLYLSSGNNLTDNIINTTGISGRGIQIRNSVRNNLTGNSLNISGSSGFGIFIWNSNNNNLTDNTVYSSGSNVYGIYLAGSNEINVTNNTVVTTQTGASGINIESSNNAHLKNCNISTMGTDAHGIDLWDMKAIVEDSKIDAANGKDFRIRNDGNITAINCSFNTVEATDGILLVKNYLSLQAFYNDSVTPIPNADVMVEDNSLAIYSSTGYGGTDPLTNVFGQIYNILVQDRWYYYSNTANENITNISVKKTMDLSWEEVRTNVSMNSTHTELFISSNIIAPSIPTGLMVSRVSGTNNLTITWDPNPEIDIFNYTIYTNKTGQWTIYTNITHPINSTLDINLPDEIWYYYRVQAWDVVDLSSGHSMPVGYYLTDIMPPAIPKGLSASPVLGGDALNITWSLNTDDTVNYELWWRDSPFGTWMFLGNFSNITSWFIFENENLVNGSTHFFKLSAWDEIGIQSSFSSVINITHRDYLSPEAPTNLGAVAISETKINITWSSSTSSDVEHYRVYMNLPSSNSGGPYKLVKEVDDQTLEHQITGLLENKTYYFVVISLDEADNPSVNSNEAMEPTLGVPPTAPILDPLPKITNIVDWNVTGTAEIGTSVFIYNNGIDAGNDSTNATGGFGIDLILIEGINKIATKAVDQANLWSSFSLYQIVVLNTTKPEAKAGLGKNLTVGSINKFDGTNSTDDDKIENYTWTFEYNGKTITLYGPEPEFKFDREGTYEVTLTVKDNAGNTDTDTTIAHVVKSQEKDTEAPKADAGADQQKKVGDKASFDGSGSTDNIGISNYTWTFTYIGSEFELYGESPEFVFELEGNYEITLTIIDFTIPPNKDIDTLWVNVTAIVVDDDTDDDGMKDSWEDEHGFDKTDPNDATGDEDSDGLNNLDEHNEGTDPRNSDSDDDGLPDGWEVEFSLDPLDNGTINKDNGPEGDPDGDGQTNLEEYNAKTDPTKMPKDEEEDGDNFMIYVLAAIIIIVILLLIIGFAMRTKKPADEEEALEEEETEEEEELECPECGAELGASESVCPECGAEFEDEEDEDEELEEEDLEDQELEEEEPIDEELDEEELEEEELEDEEFEEEEEEELEE